MKALAAALLVFTAGCSCCTRPAAPAEPPQGRAAQGQPDNSLGAPPAKLPPDAERDFIQAPDMKFTFVPPSKGYPLATCVVTGDDLAMGGEPVAVLCDGTEVQFCCHHCVEEFRKDPAKYLTMVRRATPSK